ncbi:MAG: glycosyltransferase family 2 protein [Lachnospiraceae bacterium]|nr:glycosyltransferase family 2 protein [Lachnospiraceae bacterium]
MNNIILIIPSYNEAENIERVVDELISGYPQFDYVVVTDGPTDGTDEICRKRGYNTVFLPENMGLTKCFRNGMKYAYENGYEYAVQFDGDGQHRPEYIDSMKKKAEEGYDLVQGSRFLSNGSARMSGMRSFGSVLIRTVVKLKTGVRVTDPTCGQRLYSRKLIDDFANKDEFAPEPDTVAKLLKRGVRYAEVPVRVAEREGGESYLKPLNAVKYMWRILSSIIFK